MVIFEVGVYQNGQPVYLLQTLKITRKALPAHIAAASILIASLEPSFDNSDGAYLACDYRDGTQRR